MSLTRAAPRASVEEPAKAAMMFDLELVSPSRREDSCCGYSPEERSEALGGGAPSIGNTEKSRSKDKNRSLAENVGNRDPEEVEQPKNENGVDQQLASLRLGLVELDAEGIKRWC
jgi:hypothetical protein